MPRLMISLIAVALGVSVLTSCDSNNTASTTSTTTSSTTSTPPSTAGGAVAPVSTPPSTSISYMTGVTAERNTGVDRVVFEFADTIPGYSVSYNNGPLTDLGQGSPVQLSGTNAVKVLFTMAATSRLTTPIVTTYGGPKRFTPTGTQAVKELASLGDFEGNVAWGIGTQGQVPFSVSTTTSPARVVIDFAG